MIGLTSQQKRLLDFLRGRIASSGICPSYEEMAEHLGLASKSGINRLIVALERRKMLRRVPGSYRSIEVLGASDPIDAAREALARIGARPTMDNIARVATALTEARNAA